MGQGLSKIDSAIVGNGSVLALSFVGVGWVHLGWHLRWHHQRRSRAERRWGGVGDGKEREFVFNTHLFTVPVSWRPCLISTLDPSPYLALPALPPPSFFPPLLALLAANLDGVYSCYGQTQVGTTLYFYCKSLDWCSHIYCSHTLSSSQIETHY